MRHSMIRKRLLALVMAFFTLCAALVSCTDEGEGKETGGSETTGSGESTAVEPMDFSEIDLSPYIALGQYKKVPVTVREVEYLVSLREIMAEDKAYYSIITDGSYKPSGSNNAEVIVDETRVVTEGDIINVDYTGYLNGVKFDGGAATNQQITVFENGIYISGFANGFVGTAVGETSSFDVTFPENYGEASLAGKEVTFEFTVNYICEFDALTDEIANDLSEGEYATASEYEAFLRNTIVQKYLWSKIIDNATVIEYPKQQVQYCYNQNRTYYEFYAKYYSMSYEEFLTAMGMTDEALYTAALATVQEDLVTYAILKAENITVSEEEFREDLDTYVKAYMEKFGYTEEEVRENLTDSIRDGMIFDKLQKSLVEWAEIAWEE